MTATRNVRAAPGRKENPAQEPQRRPDLRLITDTPAAPRHRRALLAAAALALTACAGLFAIVVLHVLLAQGQTDINRLETRAGAEQVRHDRLRLEVADLEAPNRVVAVAKDRLGMVAADHVRYLAPPTAAPPSG